MRGLRVWGTLLLLAAVALPPAHGFAPSSNPDASTSSPDCVVCAFIGDRLQDLLPIDRVLSSFAAADPARRPPAPHRARQVAITLSQLVESLRRDYAYNVDQHRVLPMPADVSADRRAELEEPAGVVHARRNRRAALGFDAHKGPWTAHIERFIDRHLAPRISHYVDVLDAPDDKRPPNVTREQLQQATQRQSVDEPHPSDLIRALSVYVDAVHSSTRRVQPPAHFVARLMCIMELELCPEEQADAVVEADAALDTDADLRRRAHDAPPIAKKAAEANAERVHEFTALFAQHLSEAVREWQAQQPREGNTGPPTDEL